jgi:hypothetical protein
MDAHLRNARQVAPYRMSLDWPPTQPRPLLSPAYLSMRAFGLADVRVLANRSVRFDSTTSSVRLVRRAGALAAGRASLARFADSVADPVGPVHGIRSLD